MNPQIPVVSAWILVAVLHAHAQASDHWSRTDPLAWDLSQLTTCELEKFTASDLLDVRPVIVPHPESVVGANDYFMWPIAAKVNDTLVLLYARIPCHWGEDTDKADDKSGIRMVVTSSDGGKTWSPPVDVLEAGTWTESPFKGPCGGGIGEHDGIVYIALNQGVYRSADRGRSWELVSDNPAFEGIPNPVWSPGMRITFDTHHGMIVWTTTGYAKIRKETADYGNRLSAVYSPDHGQTWHYQEQALPEGIGLSEVTPLQFEGHLAFFLRNGLKNICYAQGYSETGWFPFTFAVSNVGPVGVVDSPDVAYNPRTQRLEAAVSDRKGSGPAPGDGTKVNLYSIAPSDLAVGATDWRFEGTLIQYKALFGPSDGFNPVGSVIDPEAGLQFLYVWGGDATGKAAVFQYTRSLNTPAVSQYLEAFYEAAETERLPEPSEG